MPLSNIKHKALSDKNLMTQKTSNCVVLNINSVHMIPENLSYSKIYAVLMFAFHL